MNTYSQTLYKVKKKKKSGSDEISQGQYRGYPNTWDIRQPLASCLPGTLSEDYA